jgi:hypothetical protein
MTSPGATVDGPFPRPEIVGARRYDPQASSIDQRSPHNEVRDA